MAIPFTDSQITGLVIAETTSSALSLVSSIAVITFSFSKHNLDPNKMPAFLAMSDFGLSITTLAARAFINNPSGIPCAIQGWAVHVFFISTMLWNTAMAICALLTLRAKWKFEALTKLYPWFHIIIWSFTFTNATVFASMHLYGDAVLWCWLPASQSVLRLATFFDIIWACLLFNLCVYFYIGWELRKAQRALKVTLNSDIKVSSGMHPKNDPVLAYARRVSYFILGYIIIWVPASTNRIQNSIPGATPIYILNLMQAIFTPLQGVTTFVIYFGRIFTTRRMHILKMKAASEEEQAPFAVTDRTMANTIINHNVNNPRNDRVNSDRDIIVRSSRGPKSLQDIASIPQVYAPGHVHKDKFEASSISLPMEVLGDDQAVEH